MISLFYTDRQSKSNSNSAICNTARGKEIMQTVTRIKSNIPGEYIYIYMYVCMYVYMLIWPKMQYMEEYAIIYLVN